MPFTTTKLTLTLAGPAGPAGPTGAAGPNSVTSSTTSDGTGTLSLSSLSLSTPLPLASGGTGGTTAGTARTNLGLGTADTPTFSNLSLNTGTITVPQPLAFTQTWNSTATFTALQMNITDSGPSNAASLLMDLRVGGSSVLKASKTGSLTTGRFATTGFYGVEFDSTAGNIRFSRSSDGGIISTLNIGSNSFQIGTLVTSNGSLWFSSGGDLQLTRDAANTLAQRNGGNLQQFRLYATYTSATDYHRLTIATARSTHTGMTGATITVASIIPAGAVVVGVTCKVTTAITGATSFNLGTVADPDRFGAGIGVAAGTTSDNRDWTAGTIECFPTTTSLLITAVGGNFTDGAVYVSVQYLSGQAD